jgi:hypothetical protein
VSLLTSVAIQANFQKLEKDLKAIEKNLVDQIKERFRELTDMHNAQNKRLDELDAQNQQAKTSRMKFSEFTVK